MDALGPATVHVQSESALEDAKVFNFLAVVSIGSQDKGPRGHGTALGGPTRGGRSVPTRSGPRAWNLLETDLELATSPSFGSPGKIVAAGTRPVHPDQRKS